MSGGSEADQPALGFARLSRIMGGGPLEWEEEEARARQKGGVVERERDRERGGVVDNSR